MKKFIYAAMAFAPALAFADINVPLDNITKIVTSFKGIINMLIPIMFGLAIVYFFYGLANYILSAGDPKKAADGKSIMIYGVIAIAVMASLFGLTKYLQDALGVQAGNNVVPPTVTGL